MLWSRDRTRRRDERTCANKHQHVVLEEVPPLPPPSHPRVVHTSTYTRSSSLFPTVLALRRGGRGGENFCPAIKSCDARSNFRLSSIHPGPRRGNNARLWSYLCGKRGRGKRRSKAVFFFIFYLYTLLHSRQCSISPKKEEDRGRNLELATITEEENDARNHRPLSSILPWWKIMGAHFSLDFVTPAHPSIPRFVVESRALSGRLVSIARVRCDKSWQGVGESDMRKKTEG